MTTDLQSPIAESIRDSDIDIDIEAVLPEWGLPLVFEHHRNKVLFGGRGGGKSVTIGIALVILAAAKPLRIACTRAYQSSIRESTKQIIEEAIELLDLNWFFRIEKNNITGANGSYFFFHGVEGSRQAMRSWQSVDIFWVDEAQDMTHVSYKLLRPTIRAPRSELWFSFNPRFRSDVVYEAFVARRPPRSYIKKVNYYDNDWFPDELEEERAYMEETDPNGYRHHWLGEPDDSTALSKIMTYEDMMKCMATRDDERIYVRDAADSDEIRSFGIDKGWVRHAGLDVSDAGSDGNALAIRYGPIVEKVWKWRASTLGDTALKAHELCMRHGVRRLYYDATGIGGALRSEMKRLRDKTYSVYPVVFNSTPGGPGVTYGFKRKNKDYFARRNAQMAWCLRLRAHQTGRLLNNDVQDPEHGLFLLEDLAEMEELKLDLVQPEWDVNKTGHVVIDKNPDKSRSPDIFDAICLSFASDSARGLKLRRFYSRKRHARTMVFSDDMEII